MRIVLVLLLCLGLVGCAMTQAISRSSARSRTNRLDVGISKAEALEIMGKPFKTETLQGKEKVFMVLYYVTDTKSGVGHYLWGDTNVTDDELTPLIFDNGKLIGWGNSFLQENINKYEIRVR